MPVPNTVTEALDNLYTTTWQLMRETVIDQVFDSTPFWFWLRRNGGLESQTGHRFITYPLSYAKSDRVSFIGKGGTVSLSEHEFLTDAVDEWRYLTDSIVRFLVDDQKNSGRARIVSLANQKLEVSRNSLIDKIEEVLFDDQALSASQQAISFNDLVTLVADDPTADTTVHGINQSTYTWWRNQSTNMTGSSFAVNGVNNMRTMLNDTSQNKGTDRPNIIVAGQTPYEYYEDSVTEQKRIVNRTLGDAGFENIEFKGIPMIWSPQCGSDGTERMYFLNTRYIKFIYDPAHFFRMTDWKPIPAQVDDRAAQIIVVGNLMTSRRRVHGVIYNIDTQ